MPLQIQTESRWRTLLDDFQRSGLTQVEYCRRQGVSVNTFRKRLYRRKKVASGVERNGSARFLPVTLRPSVPLASVGGRDSLTIVLAGGRRVVVGEGFEPETL